VLRHTLAERLRMYQVFRDARKRLETAG
jgi:hypothetical protein